MTVELPPPLTKLERRENSGLSRIAGRRAALAIHLSNRTVKAALWGITGIIIAAGLLREVYVRAYGAGTALGSLDPLWLGSENSLADWYGSIQLALSAVLLAAIAHGKPRAEWKYHWFGLTAVFVYLSIDEAAQLHELTRGPMTPLHLTGVLYFSWIVPYGIFCIIVGLVYLPFVLAQPKRLRGLMILSAVLYVGATIGLEGLEGYRAVNYGFDDAFYQLCIILEESLEMSAFAIFIGALFDHLSERYATLLLELEAVRD